MKYNKNCRDLVKTKIVLKEVLKMFKKYKAWSAPRSS